MDAQEAFNAFLYDHYTLCNEVGCEPGKIVDGLVEEVVEESHAEEDEQRLVRGISYDA